MCLWYQILSEVELETVHWVQASYLSFYPLAERVPDACGRSAVARLCAGLWEAQGKWVLLLVSTFIPSQRSDGGRSFGACVPVRNGEMDCERKECRASFMSWFLNLFIYISPTWSGRPAKAVHAAARAGPVWSLDSLQTGNARSLNFNIYSIAQLQRWSLHFLRDSHSDLVICQF